MQVRYPNPVGQACSPPWPGRLEAQPVVADSRGGQDVRNASTARMLLAGFPPVRLSAGAGVRLPDSCTAYFFSGGGWANEPQARSGCANAGGVCRCTTLLRNCIGRPPDCPGAQALRLRSRSGMAFCASCVPQLKQQAIPPAVGEAGAEGQAAGASRAEGRWRVGAFLLQAAWMPPCFATAGCRWRLPPVGARVFGLVTAAASAACHQVEQECSACRTDAAA
jgi:hypothetical protein